MPGAPDESLAAVVTYRLLRELGRRARPTHAALRENEPNAISEPRNVLVVQRFAVDASLSSDAMAVLVREARCLVKNWHPNVATVRHVDLSGGSVFVATDLIDGITLEDLVVLVKTTSTGLLAPSIVARILLDVLAGLHAIHSLRDDEPLDTVHGELCPANVVIGRDGVARIITVFRPRPVTITAASEALCYASPESLTSSAEVRQDARIDLWAVGVMLWELLTGQRLFHDIDPGRIAQRQRAEEVGPPPGALAQVAMKAIAFDPLGRFPSASDMIASIRALDVEVAAGAAVAQIVVEHAGERIRLRRSELHPGGSGQRRAVQVPPKPAPSGSRPRVSVATSIAPLESSRVGSTGEAIPPSRGGGGGEARSERRPLSEPRLSEPYALMSFEKSAPILEGAPDSRPSRPGKPKMTPPPGRVRRPTSHFIGAPHTPPSASARGTDSAAPDVEGAGGTPRAHPSPSDVDVAPRPVIAHAVSSSAPPPSASIAAIAAPASAPSAESNATITSSRAAAPLASAVPSTTEVAPPPSFSSLDSLTAPLGPPPPASPGALQAAASSISSESTRWLSVPHPPALPTPATDVRDEVTVRRPRVAGPRPAEPLMIATMAVVAIAVLFAGAAVIAGRASVSRSVPVVVSTAAPPSTVIVLPPLPAKTPELEPTASPGTPSAP